MRGIGESEGTKLTQETKILTSVDVWGCGCGFLAAAFNVCMGLSVYAAMSVAALSLSCLLYSYFHSHSQYLTISGLGVQWWEEGQEALLQNFVGSSAGFPYPLPLHCPTLSYQQYVSPTVADKQFGQAPENPNQCFTRKNQPAHFLSLCYTPHPATQRMDNQPLLRGGFPPQKAHTYIYPEVPTGILTQPLWRTSHAHTSISEKLPEKRNVSHSQGSIRMAAHHRTREPPPPPPLDPASLQTKVIIVGKTKSPRREIVRSSAGAGIVYPPFLGVIHVAYPKA